MDHSEYREEIPHGDHPISYDRAEPGYRSIALLMAVTVVMLVAVGVGVQVYYEATHERTVYEQVLSQPNWQLEDLRRKEAWELTHYGYVDEEKKAVRIPIDEAMKLVARDAAENRPGYPTKPYRVKTPEELAGTSPVVSQPGAAAAIAGQSEGATSSPNVQPPPPKH